MHTDVISAAQTVARKANVSMADVRVVMSHDTYIAALQNEAFGKHFGSVQVIDRRSTGANLVRLAEYFGVGSVEMINPTGADGLSLFADVCWVFTQGPNVEAFDDSYGSERWGVRFAANDGFTLAPWRENMIRVQVLASMAEYKLKTLSPVCGYLITNTSSAV